MILSYCDKCIESVFSHFKPKEAPANKLYKLYDLPAVVGMVEADIFLKNGRTVLGMKYGEGEDYSQLFHS